MNDDELINAVTEELKMREEKSKTEDLRKWCTFLDAIPRRFKPRIKGNYVAEVELQPHRWFTAGLDNLKSAHVTSHVQLFDGNQGPPMQCFLPYPVFLAGAEIFLKGMWLCRFPACRRVAHNFYVNPKLRAAFNKRLRDLGHDLIGIIRVLKRVKKYRTDPRTMLFLNRVTKIIRYFYYPLYQADRLGLWAAARYPKRFYDDQACVATADALPSFPDQRFIISLFEPMAHHLDNLWALRRSVIEARNKRRGQTQA